MNIKGIVITAVVGAALVLVGCGTNGSGSANSAEPQILKYAINAPGVEAKDANGVQHDNFKALTSTVVNAGVPVTIVVENYDSGQHGMFFASLGITQLFEGTKVEGQPAETSFTFTPTKSGDLRWYCPIPCDSEQGDWAMSPSASGPGQNGFMAGTITVR